MLPTDKFPPAYDLFQPADQELLQRGIEKRFTEIDVRKLLLYKTGWDWDVNIASGNFKDRVFLLIKHLDNCGQLHWLIDLVDRERMHYEIFTSLRAKVTPPLPDPALGHAAPGPIPAPPVPPLVPPAAADPWAMVLLDTDQPFLDRSNFRNDCRLVGMGHSKPILSVTGNPDTGKSYTARYLAGVGRSLAGTPDGFVTKGIHLDQLNGVITSSAPADVTGLRLAQRLSLAITDEDLPSRLHTAIGSEQETAWASDAAHWIMANAQTQPRRWIILDGFETTVLSLCAQAMINSLIAEVANDAKLRIALLGYPGNLSWCTARLRHVALDLAEFSDPDTLTQHVINYLLEVRKAAEQRQRPPFTDVQLHAEVRTVLGEVDPAALDLNVLEASLTAIAERVLVGV